MYRRNLRSSLQQLRTRIDVLRKGRRGDWQAEGYTLSHVSDVPEGQGYTKNEYRLSVKAHHEKEPHPVALGEFVVNTAEGWVKPLNVGVHENHRRKGIGTAMYSHAEQVSGLKMVPGDDQNSYARKFWSQSDRPFGDKLKKSELSDADRDKIAFNFHLQRWAQHEHMRRHHEAISRNVADQELREKHLDRSQNHRNASKAHLRRAKRYVDEDRIPNLPLATEMAARFREEKPSELAQRFQVHDLEKSQGRITFPKLGVTSRPDQEVHLTQTPRQAEMVARNFANKMWRNSKYAPPAAAKEFQTKQIISAVSPDKMDEAKMQGATLSTGGYMVPRSSSVAFETGKLSVAREHEGFHHLMNLVEDKHGDVARLKIVGHLHSLIPEEDQKAIHESLVRRGYKSDPSARSVGTMREEAINHVHDAVHHEGIRNTLPAEMHPRLKPLWQKIRSAAAAIGPEFFADKVEKSEEGLDKSKNVRERKKELFGDWQTSPDSPERKKQMEHISRFAEKRYNAPVRRAPGKKNKQGKTIDKPDLTTGHIEHIGNPDSLIHELAHLETAPEGVSMKQFQIDMDDEWGKQNVKYGFKQQARLAPEYEATAIENKMRRELALPAHRKERTIVEPRQEMAADRTDTKVVKDWPSKQVKTKDAKGRPAVGKRKLAAGSEVLSQETKRTLLVRDSSAKFTPETGWKSSSSPDTLVNLRNAGMKDEAQALAAKRYKK